MESLPNALIGYAGFVGGNILSQQSFEYLYNSQNIEDIQGKEFNLVVCAGAPGTKWIANKEPENDLTSITKLMQNLERIHARKVVLISTIDVYSSINGMDEDTPIETSELHAYGKHRRMLEEFVESRFDSLIVRLPALFGKGLKKNALYDFMHGSFSLINHESILQFYNLDYIWNDITKSLFHNLSAINIATEPIIIKELISDVFGSIPLSEEKPPVSYNIHTKYASLWGNSQPYLYSKNDVVVDIKLFVKNFSE